MNGKGANEDTPGQKSPWPGSVSSAPDILQCERVDKHYDPTDLGYLKALRCPLLL